VGAGERTEVEVGEGVAVDQQEAIGLEKGQRAARAPAIRGSLSGE
jgi:hypothetical protein